MSKNDLPDFQTNIYLEFINIHEKRANLLWIMLRNVFCKHFLRILRWFSHLARHLFVDKSIILRGGISYIQIIKIYCCLNNKYNTILMKNKHLSNNFQIILALIDTWYFLRVCWPQITLVYYPYGCQAHELKQTEPFAALTTEYTMKKAA